MTATVDSNTENQLAVQFHQTNSNSSQQSKSTFELEPNPFEKSFAKKEKPNGASNTTGAGSPQVLTPGGRKLPPLVLSPNVQSGWGPNGFPRTGLTPNESSLRTGLTPGGANFPHSLNGLNLPGINTPGSLGFGNFTPGLSSLLGATNNADQSQQSQQPQQPNQPQQQQPPPPPQLQQQQPQNAQFQPPQQINVQAPQQPLFNPTSVPSIGTIPSATSKEEIPPPSKRGRKKGSTKTSAKTKEEPKAKKQKVEPKKDVKNEEPIFDDEKDLTEEEKRRNFLERNRVAASKCRQRKKQQQVEMKNDLKFYLNEYNNLTAAMDQLKEQALLLRSSLISNKVQTSEIAGGVENIMTILNSTNYLARLRGNSTNTIVPTVQPINPALVQQPPVAQGPPVPVPQAQQLLPGQPAPPTQTQFVASANTAPQ